MCLKQNVNIVWASRVCCIHIGRHRAYGCHSSHCPPLIHFALLSAHLMCSHQPLWALLPPCSSFAPILGLLPTIMLHCSSQDNSLLSCYLPKGRGKRARPQHFACPKPFLASGCHLQTKARTRPKRREKKEEKQTNILDYKRSEEQ